MDPFAPHLTAVRRARVAALLGDTAATLLVADRVNIRYLTGFDGTSGVLALRTGGATLFTDSRYIEQAAYQAPGVALMQARDPLRQAVAEHPHARVEGHAVSADQWMRLLGEHPDVRLAKDYVGQIRTGKDSAEVQALERACTLSAQALQEVLADGVLGRTEREVARRLEWLLGQDDGEGPGFPSIVASGVHSSRPHHAPTNRRIEPGDLLTIDYGARVRGYHADITRTYIVGSDPLPWQRDLHGLVERAQAAAMAAVLPGMAVARLDAAARSIIADAGYGEYFGHGLGHGVGLDIHERPLIGSTSTGTIDEAMAITIEPGVYLPGRGGVRIEDTVIVGPDGCRPLADLPREILVVQ